MWLDPLDELIDDLEAAAAPSANQPDLPDLVSTQRLVHAILAGRETLERAKRERWYQEVTSDLDRLAKRWRHQ